MANVKKLNVAAMKKIDAKEFGTQKQIDVNGYVVTVDKKFRQTKIAMMLREIIEKFDYCRTNGIDFDKLDLGAYLMFLMVKYFTSVDIPDSFEEQLNVLEIMIDNNLLEPIINAFDQEELDRVAEMQKKLTENSEKMIEELQRMELQNADVLDILGNDLSISGDVVIPGKAVEV